MLFNSIDFAVFLPIVFFLYWFVTNKNLKLQNLLIVVASYVFYGWWDWRFLSLILFSTSVNFLIGTQLVAVDKRGTRKLLLLAGILINLGFLGFFKYYNFFLDNLLTAFTFLGMDIKVHTLNIILPLGISFYTFQTLSYIVDVYNHKLEPTKDFVAFSAFVSFFPQLVAGPIERATNLLPQFYKKREFDYGKAVDGMRQMLWGLIKKIVIADNCAQYANLIFNNSESFSGSTLVLGAIFFTFQIYGDFSGYSDIAIGTSRLFGFNLKQNFAFPYFSRDIAEFWRRWHISLSTWFRDYLYIPLGGSRGSKWMRVRNTFIIFIVSGFWHGANWTFIVWGGLHALYFMPLLLLNQNRKNLNVAGEGRVLPTPKEFLQISCTFAMTVLAWIFFRADNISHAMSYLSEIFSPSLFTVPRYSKMGDSLTPIVLCVIFVVIEWFGRNRQYAIESLGTNLPRPARWSIYYVFVALIVFASLSSGKQDFIYFQF